MTALPAGWLVPDWPTPPGVRAVFTTRAGGVSSAPFDSMNLGEHVRDEPACVLSNRARLAQAIGARPVYLQQIHGTAVEQITPSSADGLIADACVSTQTGVACTVMVADCLPVLWCHASARVVAASHAGWRGLAGTETPGHGVLESTVRAIAQVLDDTDLNRVVDGLRVWLGPCIGPAAFEVGEEVREAFVAADPRADRCFLSLPTPGKFLADLPRLARQRLQALGIDAIHGNNGHDAWCTVTQSTRYFSHRRDAVRLGSTGRMAACIWLAD